MCVDVKKLTFAAFCLYSSFNMETLFLVSDKSKESVFRNLNSCTISFKSCSIKTFEKLLNCVYNHNNVVIISMFVVIKKRISIFTI